MEKMDITEENKAKEYYISSDINGIHAPSRNTVELNQLDLYKLMYGYAQEQLKNHGDIGHVIYCLEDGCKTVVEGCHCEKHKPL